MKKNTSKIMKAMKLLIEVAEESRKGNIGGLCQRVIRIGTARQSGHTEVVGEFIIEKMVKGESWLVVAPDRNRLACIFSRVLDLLYDKEVENCRAFPVGKITLGEKGCVCFVGVGMLEKARGRSFDGVICDDASYLGEELMREIEAFCGIGSSNRIPLLVLVG